MAKRFVDVFAEQQRVIILQMLNEDNDCKLNNLIIQKGLAAFGHNVSLDKVNTECAWLEEQSLVSIEDLDCRVKIITITQAGLDVANGSRIVPGIDRPVTIKGF